MSSVSRQRFASWRSPADIPLGLASVRLPQTGDERLPLGSAGHIPFSTLEVGGDNRQEYGSSGFLLPEIVPPGISAGAWAFLPFPAVSSPHRKAQSHLPVVRRLLSLPAHTGRRQNQSHPHPHRSRSRQIQQILLEKYQTELDRRSLGTLMYRLDQKGYVNVDVSTRVNLYTAKVKEEEARKKKGREILKLWYDGSLDQLVSDLYSAEDEDEEDN